MEKPLTYNEALNVLRILQEATANALKHSGCTRLVCEVSGLGEALRFRITDNGKGFVSVGPSEGNGIPNMQERARESGFDLRIDSEVGRGTGVELRIG